MKTPKPVPLHAEHVRYGLGDILAVRELDGGGVLVADVKFADGTQRTIRLAPEYWVSDISTLALPSTPATPKRKRTRAKPLEEQNATAA